MERKVTFEIVVDSETAKVHDLRIGISSETECKWNDYDVKCIYDAEEELHKIWYEVLD